MAPSPSEFDKKMLERGYWIATHRLFLEKWLSVALYVVIGFTYVVFFLQFGIYLFRYNEWGELIARAKEPFYNWEEIDAAYTPKQLEFSNPTVFATGNNRYDLVVEVFNPNEQWALESVSYQFSFNNDERTEVYKTFVLPNEKRYFTVLAFESQEQITNIVDVFDFDYKWQKLVRPPELSWITTAPPVFKPKQIVVNAGKQTVLPASVSWSVQNGSTLNIRTVVWQVALFGGGRLAGVLEYTAENFPFLSERTFEISVSDSVGRVDTVQVAPLVNIFDPNFSYLR